MLVVFRRAAARRVRFRRGRVARISRASRRRLRRVRILALGERARLLLGRLLLLLAEKLRHRNLRAKREASGEDAGGGVRAENVASRGRRRRARALVAFAPRRGERKKSRASAHLPRRAVARRRRARGAQRPPRPAARGRGLEKRQQVRAPVTHRAPAGVEDGVQLESAETKGGCQIPAGEADEIVLCVGNVTADRHLMIDSLTRASVCLCDVLLLNQKPKTGLFTPPLFRVRRARPLAC